MLWIIIDVIKNTFNELPSKIFLKGIKFILNRNLICGDFLKYKSSDGSPLIISEWSVTVNSYFRRDDFLLEQILNNEIKNGKRKFIYYKWMINSNDLKGDGSIEGKREIS